MKQGKNYVFFLLIYTVLEFQFGSERLKKDNQIDSPTTRIVILSVNGIMLILILF